MFVVGLISNCCNICVHVKDGDVLGIFNAVMEKGGVGDFDEKGNYVFVPWPCACVKISDIRPLA